MNLKQLNREFKKHPMPIQLISTEGDIYLCRIDGQSWLTDPSEVKPMQFQSIYEAKSLLGKELASHMELVMSSAYEEMIGHNKEEK